jgi:hypothetical protein
MEVSKAVRTTARCGYRHTSAYGVQLDCVKAPAVWVYAGFPYYPGEVVLT